METLRIWWAVELSCVFYLQIYTLRTATSFVLIVLVFFAVLDLSLIQRYINCAKTNVQCESKNTPPEVFWHFFPNGWEFFINFLHTYCMFQSTLDGKFLFNYLQLWLSYAILSATTQFTSYAQCPPSAETHVFRCLRKSSIALLIVVCGKSSQICCSALFSFGWSLALTEVCEMLEASHTTHGSRVGWGLVSLVDIGPLRNLSS